MEDPRLGGGAVLVELHQQHVVAVLPTQYQQRRIVGTNPPTEGLLRRSAQGGLDRLPPGSSQTLAEGGVAQQPCQRLGQPVHRARLDEEAGDAVGDEARDAGDARGHDGDFEGHRLEQDVGQPLAEAA